MHILRILNEGVIKVPASALNDAMNIICTDIFSRVFSMLNDEHLSDMYPEQYSIFMKKMKEYQKQYGRFSVYDTYDENTDTKGSFHLQMGDIDSRYKQSKKYKQAVYTVRVLVTPSDAQAPSGEYFKKKTGIMASLTIAVPLKAYILSVIKSPELFDSYMDRLEGVAEHELMHAIQNFAFDVLPDDPGYYDSEMNIKDDEYYTSEFEYGPQIISATKEFISYIKELRALGLRVDAETVRKLLYHYVKPDSKSVAGIESLQGKFFEVLYRLNKAQWKKAVKYFHGLVMDKITL